MKIVIIGSKGMLGQELVHVFSQGNKVLSWDTEDIDIIDQVQSSDRLRDTSCDLVINAAAYNDVDQAESNHELADKVNGYGPGNLAQICKSLDIPLVHYSTDYVFAGDNKNGYTEDDTPDPQSAYAQSKYMGEKKVQEYTDKFYLIRLSRLFGKSAKSKNAKKSFIDLMRDLSKKKDVLQVVDEELSCPTYALDLAKRTKHMIDFRVPYGIYHAANTGGVTWYGFAQELFNILKKNVTLEPVPASNFPRDAKRPKYSVLLNTKLEPMRPWQEALREFLITNSLNS